MEMRLLLIFALTFTLSAQQESGSKMMKKVMNDIGEEGRENVISSLDEDDLQKLMDCVESVCEMADFRSMMKKITPIIKRTKGAKGVSKLMSMFISDGNVKERSHKGVKVAVMTLPYYHPVPGGLRPGMAVYARGTVPKDSDGFGVDFATAKHEGADIAFHFNPRFKSWNQVVFNTFESRSWRKEEKRKMPFQRGKDFEAIFLVTEVGYQILVNGKQFYVFRHRIPSQSVQFIRVVGDLELQSVNVTAAPTLLLPDTFLDPKERLLLWVFN